MRVALEVDRQVDVGGQRTVPFQGRSDHGEVSAGSLQHGIIVQGQGDGGRLRIVVQNGQTYSIDRQARVGVSPAGRDMFYALVDGVVDSGQGQIGGGGELTGGNGQGRGVPGRRVVVAQGCGQVDDPQSHLCIYISGTASQEGCPHRDGHRAAALIDGRGGHQEGDAGGLLVIILDDHFGGTRRDGSRDCTGDFQGLVALRYIVVQHRQRHRRRCGHLTGGYG